MAPPGVEIADAPHPILAGAEARYAGQPVALVLAASRALAEDAAELVEVDYEPAMPPAASRCCASSARRRRRRRVRRRRARDPRAARDPAHRRRADGDARRAGGAAAATG